MHSTQRARRLPKNHQLVYEVVSAQPPGVHAAASAIYAEARRCQPGLGCSTVYRALDRLCRAGLLQEVRVPGSASALYEAARAGHAHFRCSGCGRVEDIGYDIPAADIDAINRDHALSITGVLLTFNGLCRSCVAASSPRRSA